MFDPFDSDGWEPWTGTVAELADLDEDVEVIDIGRQAQDDHALDGDSWRNLPTLRRWRGVVVLSDS